MSPAPHKNTIPQHQRWTIVQRGVSWTEIRGLAKRLAQLDGRSLDDHHKELIGHLVPSKHKDKWLKIWVTIVQTLGLAYTAKGGTTIHITDLGCYAEENNDPLGFYLYWALRFQFPHAFPKQKHYVEHDVCIQPVVLLLEYLILLHERTGSQEAHLTFDEIINFCMRQHSHLNVETNTNVKKILEYREKGYDYRQEKGLQGYTEVRKHLAGRIKLYFAPAYFRPSPLLIFKKDRISIAPNNLEAVPILLAFRESPTIFKTNTEGSRNKYMRNAFTLYRNQIPELLEAYKTRQLSGLTPSAELEKEEAAAEFITKQNKTKEDLLKDAKKYVAKASYKRKKTKTTVRNDDERQKARIKEIEDYSCQIDGFTLEYRNKNGKTCRYIEAAHIKGKRLKGTEALDNIIILCPNCHKRLDHGAYYISKENRPSIIEGKKSNWTTTIISSPTKTNEAVAS